MQSFNETEWVRLLFLLSDTQSWLEQMQKTLLRSLPCKTPEKLFRKTCYLSVPAFAHIIERHYNKIPRHPGTGKFTIPIPEILQYLKEVSLQNPSKMSGTQNLVRELKMEANIGFDKCGTPTAFITLITDSTGNIITAFPGSCENAEKRKEEP